MWNIRFQKLLFEAVSFAKKRFDSDAQDFNSKLKSDISLYSDIYVQDLKYCALINKL